MSRLGNVNSSLMIKFLKKRDFKKSRQKGSHMFFRHIDGRTATVPVHKGEDLGKGLLSKILRDIQIDKSEFIDWLDR